MIKNNLKILDIDEPIREDIEDSYKNLLSACKILGLTLDAATSDVALYVENSKGDSICIE